MIKPIITSQLKEYKLCHRDEQELVIAYDVSSALDSILALTDDVLLKVMMDYQSKNEYPLDILYRNTKI